MERLICMTGVTGHSGRFAIERLAMRRDELRGMRFRALVRDTSEVSHIQNSELPIELVYGDIRDEATLRDAISGADTVLHIVGIFDSPLIMKLAAEAGVRRVILVHTTGIYSKYKSASAEYIEIDRQVTEMAARSGIQLTILRPTMIYGGLDDQNVITFIRMMDKLPIMPTVSGARFELQPVHRRDLGYAYADVLLAEPTTLGKNYVLSGKEPITLRDMLTVIGQQLGKEKIRFVSCPFWLAFAGAWGIYLLSFTKIDYREKVQRLVEPRCYPHEEATSDFDYAPMSFSEGVADEVAAYLQSKGSSK